MMVRTIRYTALLLAAVVLIFHVSCTPLRQELRPHTPESDDFRTLSTIPMTEVDGQWLVSMSALLEKLEYQSQVDYNERLVAYGDTDVLYRVEAGNRNVRSEGEEQPVTLSDAPVWKDNQVWLTPDAATTLFRDIARFRQENHHLLLLSSASSLTRFDESVRLDGMEPLPDFADDPDGDSEQAGASGQFTAHRSINVDNLIREARKYQGVGYEFGASKYSVSGAFDCSSFVQHVFDKFGIDMPRASRHQAEKGTTVSRSSLRKGDLLYFYVPGRFRTNKTVGHVGIYIGNQRMIHSAPEPKDGVQITDINKPYWKETFLKAKRVI